ncbi:hypothetical protein [Salana multivorans]
MSKRAQKRARAVRSQQHREAGRVPVGVGTGQDVAAGAGHGEGSGAEASSAGPTAAGSTAARPGPASGPTPAPGLAPTPGPTPTAPRPSVPRPPGPATSATPSPTPPGERPSSPPSGVHAVGSSAEAAALARRLREEEMAWPVVVVTTAAGQSEPYVPADELAAEVDGLAEVVVMPTGAASWAFSEQLPPMTQVYGGASRVYAPDRAWLRDPYASPLRFAWSSGDGARAKELLVSDAARTAFAAHTVGAPRSTRRVSGEVMGSVGSRGLVRLDHGGTAAIWPELTVAGVPIERLVRPGQRVEGELDDDTLRLDVRDMLELPEVELAGADLLHVPVRVAGVERSGVTVELVPGGTIEVAAEHAADDDPRSAFEPGEVVVGTWFADDDASGLVLRLDLWDGEEAVTPAPALLHGGPPWLEVPPPSAEEDGSDGGTGATAEGAESADGSGDPADAGASVDLDNPLAPELLALRRAHAEHNDEIARLRSEIRELRRAGRQVRGKRRRSEIRGMQGLEDAFLDPAEQLRFEVYLAWASRIPAGDKAARPLREYRVGPVFLDSLETLEGVRRGKVVDVVVEVLTGLAKEMEGRDLHRLRTGDSGGSPYRVREDGAVGWRAALQRETASARRLHYWECPDGTVELSRVVKHDDMEP